MFSRFLYRIQFQIIKFTGLCFNQKRSFQQGWAPTESTESTPHRRIKFLQKLFDGELYAIVHYCPVGIENVCTGHRNFTLENKFQHRALKIHVDNLKNSLWMVELHLVIASFFIISL